MAKLIMWNVMTLDGFFEGEKNWDLSFHELVWGPELEKFSLEQLNSASHLVFGRVTFEGMSAYWKKEKGEIANFMNSISKIVCSTTLDKADWENSILLKDDVANEIASIKKNSDKDLYVFGSANLCETLMKEDLIDEYRICIAPVVLGKGRYLFAEEVYKKLSLLNSKPLSTGGMIITYSNLE